MIELLVKLGADINTRGVDCDNALQAASCHGTADTVCFLLGHGADVNARGGKYLTALIAASHRCRVENVCTLRRPGLAYGLAVQPWHTGCHICDESSLIC